MRREVDLRQVRIRDVLSDERAPWADVQHQAARGGVQGAQGGNGLRRRRVELLRRLWWRNMSHRDYDHYADRHDAAANDDDARAHHDHEHDRGDVHADREELYDECAVLLAVLLPGPVLLRFSSSHETHPKPPSTEGAPS